MEPLRALFTAGPGRGFSAQAAFTNRVDEVEAFRRAVTHSIDSPGDGRLSPVVEIGAPRTNVLVYYGIGGIGKTTLSRELERRLVEGVGLDAVPERRAAIRVDVGEAGDFDLETFVLRLRAGLGELAPRWRAFDLVFGLYWERAHPGQPLAEFIGRNTLLERHAARVGLGEQIEETLTDLAKEIGMVWAPVKIGQRVLGVTYDRVRRAITEKRLLADCPFFEALADAEANAETLAFLPSLLAWDLEQLGRKRPALPVVFLDTFEAVGQRRDREIERLIQRAVHLMPNVLWVVTGRNRLDWAEVGFTGELDYVGADRWPWLYRENRTDEPRQHLVGALSASDCDAYLRNVLINTDGTPVLDAAVRGRIAASSEGWPLYLDVAVTLCLQKKGVGMEPTPEDFDGPLPALVSRVMRDLDADERRIVRGVSLLDAFDADLARAAAGNVPDAAVAHVVDKPLVRRTTDNFWPYTLHATVREAVRATDADLSDRWSQAEWEAAARRVCEHLGHVAAARQAARDRIGVAACLTQGVRVAAEFGLFPEWVINAAQFLADAGMWAALDVRPAPGRGERNGLTPLESGLRGIALRRTGSLNESVAMLDAALSSQDLPPSAVALLELHRTHSLRNSGRYDQAEGIYAQMVAGGGPYHERAALQLADILLLRGRFSEALAALDTPPADPDAAGEALRLAGHVHRFNANFDTAQVTYQRALDTVKQLASLALEGKSLTNLAETAAWSRPADGARYAEQAIEFNQGIGNNLEVLKAHVAAAVAAPDLAAAEEDVQAALDLAERTHYRSGAVFALVARIFHQILADRRQDALSTLAEITARTDEIGVYRFWPQIGRWWLAAAGLSTEPPDGATTPAQTDWLDGPETAERRWRDTLTRRNRE